MAHTVTSVTVRWDSPDTSGAPLTGFELFQFSIDEQGNIIPPDRSGDEESSQTALRQYERSYRLPRHVNSARVDCLMPGRRYRFAVAACNMHGTGTLSRILVWILLADRWLSQDCCLICVVR